MADLGEDVELGEVLLILAALGIGGYLIYKAAGSISDWFSNATCIAKVGKIPGVTGATQQQVDAAKTAVGKLKPGGRQIWSCGSDFDYQQPCGTVTKARSNWVNAIFPWGTEPVTYTDVAADSYVVPTTGTLTPGLCCCYRHEVPASAAGNPPCCGGKQAPCLTPCWNNGT